MITSNTVPIVTGPSADIEMLDVPEVVFGIDGDDVTFTISEYVEVHTADAPTYDGPYEVTPRLYQQELETSHKVMNDDVTVYEIPITRTSNPQDGLTVLIG